MSLELETNSQIIYIENNLIQIVRERTKYSGIRLLATRVLLIKWLRIREVANKGTELTQNLHLGPEDWLLIEQYC